MEICPFCGSENIYFSRKRQLYVCEDCDETFSDETSETSQKASTGSGLQLFFSYGHDRNRPLVERIKRDLERRGHHVWIDSSEIRAGDHWRDDILNGVLNTASVIAFLSEYSTRSPGVCLDELKIAVCVRGADVKTVLLEPESRIRPPATLSDIQWLDMSDWYEIKNSPVADFEQWYQNKFSELCRVIESGQSEELSGDIHTLKEQLCPYLNTEKEYRLLSKEFCGRAWLNEAIETWRVHGNSNALIIYGAPGSGKSAFSVNYAHYNDAVLGCFLCEWNRERTIVPERLLRTIAFRLAAKLPDYRSLLLRQLSDGAQLEDMSPEDLFDYLLAYPLSHLVDGNRETGLVVVDGLDEAAVEGHNPLADVFVRCVNRLPRWIKFVFTSRRERNVTQPFQGCDSLDLILDMPQGYNDIKAYLLKELAPELRAASNQMEVLNKICERSEGIFLYAELLVEDIRSGVLTLAEAGSLPKGLPAFYRTSMERKFPNRDSFISVRGLLEALSVEDTVPEELSRGACGGTRYEHLRQLDLLGAWINRFEDDGLSTLAFSHKSLRDWFTNPDKSGPFFVDRSVGALRLARLCRSSLEGELPDNERPQERLREFELAHVGDYYAIAGSYSDLEDFLLAHTEWLNPCWLTWDRFPINWDQRKLIEAFWSASGRNGFLRELQRSGNTRFLQWVFETLKERHPVQQFDRELVVIYMDVVHLSGDYAKAVEIADSYLGARMQNIETDEFLSMMSVRRLHNSMFYRPVKGLLDEALALYERLDDRFPNVYNELLFLIGGNLGVLYGDWDFCRLWLDRSEQFATAHGLTDFRKRNARKTADCLCHFGQLSQAHELLEHFVNPNEKITGRYEAYLMGALANINTCLDNDDEALTCYEKVLSFSSAKGIIGWVAHANLGIANINLKLGNLREAVDFGNRAHEAYQRIRQEWGLIMSEALLAACESAMGVAPLRIACESAIRHASQMQYGSCSEAIRELTDGTQGFLKLYFL